MRIKNLIIRAIKRPDLVPRAFCNKINEKKKTRILDARAKKIPDFFLVQVGANDGVTSDPVRKYIITYKWKGILIEPEKENFLKLKNNYKTQPQLKFENVAIADKNGHVEFYSSPRNGLSSMYPDEWYNKKKDDNYGYKNRIKVGGSKKIKVKASTFASLLQKHNVKRIDLLQIDTEGYDYEIIKQIDFSKFRPGAIHYEDRHIKDKDKKTCIALLKKNGYKVLRLGADNFAYRPIKKA